MPNNRWYGDEIWCPDKHFKYCKRRKDYCTVGLGHCLDYFYSKGNLKGVLHLLPCKTFTLIVSCYQRYYDIYNQLCVSIKPFMTVVHNDRVFALVSRCLGWKTTQRCPTLQEPRGCLLAKAAAKPLPLAKGGSHFISLNNGFCCMFWPRLSGFFCPWTRAAM